MFKLTDNNFAISGICRYKDEHGNEIKVERQDDDGFVAKIKFMNADVKADLLHFKAVYPLEEKGAYINMKYANGATGQEPDVVAGVSGFTEIVQRWIRMMYDIKNFSSSNSKHTWNSKLSRLMEYEELEPILNPVFAVTKK